MTVVADHCAPVTVAIPRRFNSAAAARADKLVKGARYQATKPRNRIAATRKKPSTVRCRLRANAMHIGLRTKRRQTFGMKGRLAFGMTIKNKLSTRNKSH